MIISNELKNLIKNLETELLQPQVRKSVERLNQLLADNFLEFGASGNRYDKKAILESLPNLNEVKYIMHDFEALEISSDTILATYSIEKEILESGEKSNSLRSSLWQKREGNWQMIFHQGTPQK